MPLTIAQAVAAFRQDNPADSVQVRAFGNSMRPLITSGETVTVRRISPPDTIRKGDIVLAKVNGRLYLHLVKAVNGDLVLIGNNQGRTNGWTSNLSVFGKVVPGSPIVRKLAT